METDFISLIALTIICVSNIIMMFIIFNNVRKAHATIYKSYDIIFSSINEVKSALNELSKIEDENADEILDVLEKLNANISTMDIRLHVAEARLDERKNITIDQAPVRGKPGRPKGYSPKKAKEIEQK